jgi:hypothetical protein
MATPARFFSTLAQSTGILLGFIVALATTIYQIKRSRVHNRLTRFREDITEYQQEYQGLITDMAAELREVGEFSQADALYRENKEPIEIVRDCNEWAENQGTPRIANLWVSLHWLNHQLSVLQGSSDLDNLRKEMKIMERPILQISSEFDDKSKDGNPRQERLFKELIEQRGFGDRDFDPQYALFESTDKIDYWIDQNTTKTDGLKFGSWKLITDSLLRDYYTIDGRKHLSGDVFENRELRTLFIDAAILFAVGVLIPMLFLVTIPSNSSLPFIPITGRLVPIVELLNLALILGAGMKTLYDISKIIG